jgi:hypothetical protein
MRRQYCLYAARLDMLWVFSLCAVPGLYSMWGEYCLRREWQFLLRRTRMRPGTAVRLIWW